MKSKAIELVLISSALVLSGCPAAREDESGDFGYQSSGTGHSGYSRSHIYHGGGWYLWGSGSSGSRANAGRTGGSVSSRGGFGGTGHAVAS
jgi:hypothetical protein